MKQDKHLSFIFIVIPNNETEFNTCLLKIHNSGIKNVHSKYHLFDISVMYKCNCVCSCYQADIAFQEIKDY